MAQYEREPPLHPYPEGVEPYTIAQKKYLCAMALFTDMTWATITLVLGQRFGQVYSEMLVENLFYQMKNRSSQVLSSMAKSTKDRDYIKEILDDCERVRLHVERIGDWERAEIEAMTSRL